jgi:carbonic anhydrase
MEIFAIIWPFLLFFLFVGLVVGIFLYKRKRERERTEQLKATAPMLGWQFVETAPFNWIPNLDKFSLFNSGHDKSIRNVLYGEVNDVKAALFDYTYVVGSGKNQTTYYQSVAYFEPRDLSLPFFSLRPENAFHKLATVFGYQDIDFGNRPLFSSKYLLRGPDEQAIRNTFTDALLTFYETNQGLATDGGGNQLFVFRSGHRAAPHELQGFMNSVLPLTNLFARRW